MIIYPFNPCGLTSAKTFRPFFSTRSLIISNALSSLFEVTFIMNIITKLRYRVLGCARPEVAHHLGFNPLYYQADWAAERGEVPARFHLSLGAL